MSTNTKTTAVAVVANETDRTIHAELLLCKGGCGALGCKEKTMEDLWFAERDHNLLANLKKAS